MVLSLDYTMLLEVDQVQWYIIGYLRVQICVGYNYTESEFSTIS
jgi:hypothetical protein